MHLPGVKYIAEYGKEDHTLLELAARYLVPCPLPTLLPKVHRPPYRLPTSVTKV